MTSSGSFSPVLHATPAALMLAALLSTDAAALGGTIENTAGTPLARAEVSLLSDPTARDTTDATGLFTLTPTSLFPHRPGQQAARSGHGPARFAVRDGTLQFDLQAAASQASVSLFSSDGRVRFATPVAPLGPGTHRFDIPYVSSGLYHLRITLDGRSTVMRVAATGAATRIAGPAREDRRSDAAAIRHPLHEAAPAPHSASAATTAKRAATADTLLVKRVGYLTTKTPVTSYGQADLTVVMSADTVSPLAPVTDYGANGPFATVVETNVGPGNNYTIIRPEILGENGFRHAPLIYGHGINGQVSTFTGFLRVVASHGFVIIARNVLTGGPNNAGNTAAMNDGLNWILAQDTTAGSPYFGKLATDRAAAMGYSVGGTAAVDIGGHPAIRTVVSIHGHISSAVLSGPLLQTSGTQDNVGLPMQEETFGNSVVQTFLGTVTDAGHGYIQNNNGGVQRAAIIAWLRFWIYNDQGAKHYFYGDDCVMCTAPWENPQRKNWD